jgi:hypothetical protein
MANFSFPCDPSMGVIPREVKRILCSLHLRQKNQIANPAMIKNTTPPIVPPTMAGILGEEDGEVVAALFVPTAVAVGADDGSRVTV